MNNAKLKGKLRECGKTYEDCSRAIGITTTSFSNKINGSSKFYIDELEKLGDYLEMTNNEKAEIFLH